MTQPPPTKTSDAPLDARFDPKAHEQRLRDRALASGAYHADPEPVLTGEREPYAILIPPPNVTDRLHLGHALDNTLQDVLIRAHRMMGHEAVWFPGTDHAGIATQTRVDKQLRSTGEPTLADFKEMEARGENGREQFIAKVQSWKDEYEETITDQLRQIGCSCDWDRQRFTMDDVCAAAVREAFFRLFKMGLIYRGKRLVNWDPVTLTALADDEVEMKEIDGKFYYLRYPLDHPDGSPVTWDELRARGYPMPNDDEHEDDAHAWITVATTRPETYLGDTAVAMHPDDARCAALDGLTVRLPLVGRPIPIITDDYVVMADPDSSDPKAKNATGFLKVTPAHDPNDWAIGQRHDLPVINVMAPDATISDAHGWEDVGDAHLFVGKSREEARDLVVREFRNRNLLENIRDHRHAVGHSYRSHVPIEPYLSDQWYVKVSDDRLRGEAQRALDPKQRTTDTFTPRDSDPSDGLLRFTPNRYAKTYESWHDNLRDWCISRQLWWGHRIPVWTVSLNPTDTTDKHIDEARAQKEHVDEADVRDGIQLWVDEAIGAITEFLEAAHVETTDYVIQQPNDYSFRICARTSRAAMALDAVQDLLESWQMKKIEPGQPLKPGLNYPPGFAVDFSFSEKLLERIFTIEQDPDVLDTWFSSALWPLSTMGWPDPSAFRDEDLEGLLGAFNPTNVLVTGRDIITLWVSRMVMFNRLFTGGDLPFTDVYIHPIIQDGQGQRMSKSLGNGVDPLDIVHAYGADATRLVMCQLATATQDVRLPVDLVCPHTGETFEPEFITDEAGNRVIAPIQTCPSDPSKKMVSAYGYSKGTMPTDEMPLARNTSTKFEIGRNFCTKLWNASRFTMMNLADSDHPPDHPLDDPHASGDVPDFANITLADKWMLSRLSAAIDDVTEAVRTYQFARYADVMYDLLWRDFCDWYLEAIKPTVKQNQAQQSVLRAALETILRLLHPICPYITEAIAEALSAHPRPDVHGLTLKPSTHDGLLCRAGWPEASDDLRNESIETRFDHLRALTTAIREVRAKNTVPPRKKITLHCDRKTLDAIEDGSGLVENMAGLESVTTDAPDGPSVALVFEGSEFALSGLTDDTDPEAERARLQEQTDKLEKDIKALEGRLNNPGYTQKAPEKLVNQTRDQLAQKQDERDKITQRLKELA